MYWEYFGFEENPFSISPDPRYLYMSKRHQEALAHLVYGIGEAGGFVLLSGEVGTGKTTICRSLIEQLPDTVDLAFVLNPRLNEVELLATICDEMGVAYPPENPTLKVLVDRLNEHLLDAHARGRQPVLIIDEAQNLSPDVLEQIRLLTNLETTKRKLLQIFLIGQPELKALLKRQGLRQLDQRITARYHLTPLTLNETAAYIRHRLQVGGNTEDIFGPSAVRAVFRLSRGVPRLINTLCDRCLLGAYAENKRKVDARLVESASTEVLGLRGAAHRGWMMAGSLVAGIAAAVAFMLIDPLDQNLMHYLPHPTDWQAQANSANDRTIEASSEVALAEHEIEVAPTDFPDILDEGPGETAPPAQADPTTPTSEPRLAKMIKQVPRPHVPASEAPGELTNIVEAETITVATLIAPTALPTTEPPLSRDTSRSEGHDLVAATIVKAPSIEIEEVEPIDEAEAQLVWGGHGLSDRAAIYDEIAPVVEPMVVMLQTPPPPVSSPTGIEDLFAFAEPFGDIESGAVELFRIWGMDYAALKGVTPCRKARYANLRCLQSQGTWHDLRNADRPAVIGLSKDGNRVIYATVLALDGNNVVISVDGYRLETTTSQLTQFWVENYLLLWRPPLPFAREIKFGRSGDDVAWLRGQLTALGLPSASSPDAAAFDLPLQEAVRSFQRSRGLTADGIAGPRTLIQINIAKGAPNTPTLH
jgi:general secretion pathway protein A